MARTGNIVDNSIYQAALDFYRARPDALPQSWLDHKKDINAATPFNFVSTGDIIGGNSGSPTVNKAGQVVGIIFDGNIQSLPWDFVYDDVQGRAVSVDSRSIIESLRKIYNASALADELTAATAKAAAMPGKPSAAQKAKPAVKK